MHYDSLWCIVLVELKLVSMQAPILSLGHPLAENSWKNTKSNYYLLSHQQ